MERDSANFAQNPGSSRRIFTRGRKLQLYQFRRCFWALVSYKTWVPFMVPIFSGFSKPEKDLRGSVLYIFTERVKFPFTNLLAFHIFQSWICMAGLCKPSSRVG